MAVNESTSSPAKVQFRILLLSALLLCCNFPAQTVTPPDTIAPDWEMQGQQALSFEDQGKPGAWFHGFHGYHLTTAELLVMETDYFSQLLADPAIPKVSLEPGMLAGCLVYMRNRLFTGMQYTYTCSAGEETDSLQSHLNQNGFGLRAGYNLVVQPKFTLSAFGGARYIHFRHVTSPVENRISLDDYLQTREVDIRLGQFSGEVGLQTTVLVGNGFSVGAYGSYLFHFHRHPILRSKYNRIPTHRPTPIGRWAIGLELGFGWNERTDRPGY